MLGLVDGLLWMSAGSVVCLFHDGTQANCDMKTLVIATIYFDKPFSGIGMCNSRA